MRSGWMGAMAVVGAVGCGGTTPETVKTAKVDAKPSEARAVAREVATVIDEARVATPAEEAQDRAVPAEAVVVNPVASMPYTPPAPFTDAERKARFPRGKLGDARTKNREGLALRAAGDAVGAKAAYAAALGLSPRFAPARYNLACELARAGDKDGALQELETLLRLATPDARLFLGRARFDADFDGVREDARFKGLVGQVRFDATRPVAEQVCADPGRIADLIDPRRGVEVYVETEDASDRGLAEDYQIHVTGKEAFDQVSRVMSSLAWGACSDEDFELTGTLKTYRLASAKETKTCLGFAEQMEWSSQYLACFVNEDGWKLASIAMFPDGPLGEDYETGLWRKARAAKERGYQNFGVAP